MRLITWCLQLIMILALANCSSYDFTRRPIQQGNLLNPTTISRLKVGMSKEDVSILMGTSLLSPMFNNNRWDYAYTWRKGSNANAIKHLTLYFKNERLSRIEQ